MIGAALLLLTTLPAAARAETLGDFAARIGDAYKAENRKAALWDLFYTAGLDPVSYGLLVETIEKMDLIRPPVIVLSEPLHPEEELVERQEGYVYFQNVETKGAVNIANAKDSSRVVRQYYTLKDGRYYLTCTIRQTEKAKPQPVPEDNWFFRRNRGQKQSPQYQQ
jgi:hypothetical protein